MFLFVYWICIFVYWIGKIEIKGARCDSVLPFLKKKQAIATTTTAAAAAVHTTRERDT